MGHPTREMPVRHDKWKPSDPMLDGIIRRCASEAEAGAARDGTREYMAGFMILAVLGVVILAFAKSATAALLIPGGLFAVGALYMVLRSEPGPVERQKVLAAVGGAGRLPAGYIVHPAAWEAGMAEHVAYIPESQLKAAAEMSRSFPGSVDDLLLFTGTIAAQVPIHRHAGHADIDKRARELAHVGLPILKQFNEKYPRDAGAGAAKGKKTK